MAITKKRILLLSHTHNPWGGMELWLESFAAVLQARDWEVHLGLARGLKHNDPEKWLKARNFRFEQVYFMDARYGSERARVNAILDTWAKSNADVILPIAIGSVFPAVRILKSKNKLVKLVVPVRSCFPDYLHNITENADIIDHVVGVNRLIESYFREFCPSLSDRISYVRHGVFQPGLNSSRRSSGAISLGFVGRLEQTQKRALDLVSFAEQLCSKCSDFELHIFGDGSCRDPLLAELKRLSVNFTFHGYLGKNELYEHCYPQIEALLLFSDEEAGPFVIYEAMRHGVVPISSRYIGHASEGLLRHGVNCLTFPVGDVQNAARHVSLLIRDRDLLRSLSTQAIIDSEICCEDRMHNDWIQVVDHVIDRATVFPDKPHKGLSGAVVAAGRLEKLRIPSRALNSYSGLIGKLPFASGFEEWPGTLPVKEPDRSRVVQQLLELEKVKSENIYGKEATSKDKNLQSWYQPKSIQ